MKLLVITQTVDKKDSVLGFFHGWLLEFSKKFEKVSVICLYEGEHNLPENVFVYSLGKESSKSKLKYLTNFFYYIWKYRKDYDMVFVHMNQEYVLLGGLFWKILGKKIFFWRNHSYGNILTRLSVALSTKVFCTSASSFTAKFKKTVIMPAGIDTSLFHPVMDIVRVKHSICMVGRISPVKHIFEAILVVNYFVKNGEQFSLTVIGDVGQKIEDKKYMDMLMSYVSKNSLQSHIKFEKAVLHQDLPKIYSSYEICLNLTDSGSFDKTIIEAASVGTFPIVSNQSLSFLLPDGCVTERNLDSIVLAIRKISQPQNQLDLREKLTEFAKSQSLDALMEKLSVCLESI
jgi:glycosyltransferase involved in cell wall biosynthesis